MLVHVKRDELLAIAAQTAKAAPKTATSEAVLGIHVEADSRRSMLTLTATNYEIVIRASMGASVEQSGSVVISAALFPAAIASLPEQDVDLETEHPGQLTIRSGHARFRLSALSGDKYPMPELPFPDDTLPVSGLRSLARNTLFAVAEDGVPSPPMKCFRLHVGPDGLKASASNGFCIMEADGDKQCKGQIELLLPARSLKVLASLSNDSDVYEMGVTGKSLVFWSGTLLFSARLVEGKFPNTSGIFEQFKCQYSVHLDAAEFIRALEVAESVSESNHRVELTFGEHEITVSAESACGRSSAPVKALVLNAPKQPFYYNSRKLLEYLRLEKEKITLEFDKFGLLVVRSGSTRYVQSPMRALYPKGSEPIYLCVNCNAYVGCYPDGSPMGKVANTVLRLKRQETHRIFDRFWREQGWTRSAAYRWLAQNLHLKEHETHIGMMEMDECEQVIRLCRKYGKHKKEVA